MHVCMCAWDLRISLKDFYQHFFFFLVVAFYVAKDGLKFTVYP